MLHLLGMEEILPTDEIETLLMNEAPTKSMPVDIRPKEQIENNPDNFVRVKEMRKLI